MLIQYYLNTQLFSNDLVAYKYFTYIYVMDKLGF